MTVPRQHGFVHVKVEMVLLRSNEKTGKCVIRVEDGETDSNIRNDPYNERIAIMDPRVVTYHYESIKV